MGCRRPKLNNKLLQAISAFMRYRGQEYFWINDTTPTMIMHPINKKLDGQNLSDFKDPNGLRLFIKMVEVTRANDEGGYVHYLWPGQVPTNPSLKSASCVNLSLGAGSWAQGLYLDDVKPTQPNLPCK